MKESLPALRMLNICHLNDAIRLEPSLSPFSFCRAIKGCGEEKIKGKDQVQAALLRMLKRPYENPATLVTNSDEKEEEDEEGEDDGFW